MRLCFKRKDGGTDSTVTGFWLVEAKSLFSIVLLRFDVGSREVYHSHAFNAVTWFLFGKVQEHHLNGNVQTWLPSYRPKYTPRSCFHKVFALKTTYAVSIRGPWVAVWKEYNPITNQVSRLTKGRKIL